MSNNDENLYRILGLEPGVSIDEIKEAWRELVKVWHPDRFTNDPKLQKRAHEKLKEINGAYEVLVKNLNSKSAVKDELLYKSEKIIKTNNNSKHKIIWIFTSVLFIIINNIYSY